MKRLFIVLILVFTFFAGFAQKGKVTSAQNLKESGDLKKALETINTTVDPANEKSEKTIDWPNTWEVRGEIYQAIFQSEDAAIKSLAEDPLTEALKSYKKALELDEKGRLTQGIKVKLTLLINDLTTQAVGGFNNDDYQKALKSFEQVLEVQDIDIIKADNPESVDTIIIFNAGLAAYNAEDYDKAIKFLKEAADYGYNGDRAYSLVASAYQLKKDTLGALEVLKEGFEKYPEDENMIKSMIGIYMDKNKTDEAMKYLQVAIEQDPDNPTYHFAIGTLYEKMGNEEKAIEAYNNTIEADGTFFNGYYNLGALYYNKGVNQIDVANAVPANENEKYEAELKKADDWFKKALPYMEKCNELDPEQRLTLESLKNLYYRLKMMDKYNAILEKIGE